jgi:hypothetical protein
MAAPGKGPLNYTTSIEAEKSALECVTMLMKFGARNVGISVGEDKIADGLDFVIQLPWGARQYSVPANIGGTEKALLRAYREDRIARPYTRREQAARVAWRVLKDWLAVNLALIEAGVVELERVMLPYMKVAPGKDVFGAWVEDEMKALTAREGPS